MCCAHGNQDPTIAMWRDELGNFYRVDRKAIKALVCLSQQSPLGYERANQIVGKVIKLDCDIRLGIIRNISSFVATCVKNAREHLNPAGARFAGMSGWDNDYACV